MEAVKLSIPKRTIKTRRMEFRYAEGLDRKHYAKDGDPTMSHVVAVLSSLFPEGEDFFVQSVRNYRDKITDPELKKQVAGFIGQEAIHGREHRELNRQLQAMGYPTRIIDRLTKYGLLVGSKVLPKSRQLSITAALEHYTSSLAELLLGDEEARGLLGDNEVQRVLLWHAVEESEHKSVAFDVFMAVDGRQWVRALTMNLVTIGFLTSAIAGTFLSFLIDPATYLHPVRTVRSLAKLRRNPWLSKEMRRRIRDYNRRDFHPDDHDNQALLEEWRERLFGAEGELTDRLKGAGAAA